MGNKRTGWTILLGGNAVMVDAHGIKHGASGPPANGQAVPENPDYWGGVLK